MYLHIWNMKWKSYSTFSISRYLRKIWNIYLLTRKRRSYLAYLHSAESQSSVLTSLSKLSLLISIIKVIFYLFCCLLESLLFILDILLVDAGGSTDATRPSDGRTAWVWAAPVPKYHHLGLVGGSLDVWGLVHETSVVSCVCLLVFTHRYSYFLFAT